MRLTWIIAPLAAVALAVTGGAARADGGKYVGPIIVGAAVGAIVGAVIASKDKKHKNKHAHGHSRYKRHGHGHKHGRYAGKSHRHGYGSYNHGHKRYDKHAHRAHGHNGHFKGKQANHRRNYAYAPQKRHNAYAPKQRHHYKNKRYDYKRRYVGARNGNGHSRWR